MAIYQKYFIPDSCNSALEQIKQFSNIRIIAGGTDLLLDLQQGRCPPVEALIDITRISELIQLEIRGDELFIGAAVPLNRIAEDVLVKYHAGALAEACGMIGGPQVRNVATLGGNVAHALPAADGTIALVALDAQVEVVTTNGYHRKAIMDMFKGPGISALERGEIITGFYVRRSPTKITSSAFNRVMRPQGVALPVLNMAVWLERENDVINDLRIAVGPAGATPQRGFSAEHAMKGKIFGKITLEAGINELVGTLKFRTSPHRATSEYRQHLCRTLLEATMDNAWKTAVKNYQSMSLYHE